MLQEKLIQAIKKIKHEVDECNEAEKDTFADAIDVEVKKGFMIKKSFIPAMILYKYRINLEST